MRKERFYGITRSKLQECLRSIHLIFSGGQAEYRNALQNTKAAMRLSCRATNAMHKLLRVVVLMSIISFCPELCSCSLKPDAAQSMLSNPTSASSTATELPNAVSHTPSDITAVSISCTHMDFNCCYSFSVYQKNGAWLLDAVCWNDQRKEMTELEAIPVSNGDIAKLFEILDQNNSIANAEHYVKPEPSEYEALDATTYSCGLRFSDKCVYTTPYYQQVLEAFFFRLAAQSDHGEAE